MNIELLNIESIEELDLDNVYDISIEEGPEFFQNEHNYIANKIVVHNSHAAGIVVSDVPLDEIAPLRTASKGMLATQYPNEDLEELGLIKFDVLAIATLSVIKKTVEMIKEYWEIDIDLENLPIKDEPTLALYRQGNLGGVFQCENYGMQKTMRDIGVDCFEDVIAALALYRPGPMDSIPEYCARKNGEKEVDYFHKSIEPFVKPYLEKTYVIICYQEQIMQICNSLAGFTITDGYVMIKAIGKKKQYLMDKFEKQFVEGCTHNKVSRDVAQQYWDKFITPFASYGFNLCLDGMSFVKNKKDGKIYNIKELEKQFKSKNKLEIILDSYEDGEIIEDELIDVFETGEKDIYEIELDNGIILKCTMDHKFICGDRKGHPIKEIIEKDLNILYF